MLSTSLIELRDHEALVAFTDGHPVARWNHAARMFERAWGLGGAAGFRSYGRFGRMLVVIGDDADAARLTTAVLDGLEPGDTLDWVTVPVRAAPRIDGVRAEGNDWDWFWVTGLVPPRPGERAAGLLDTADDVVAGEVRELLSAASPWSSAMPGDATVDRWWGIRGRDGVLLACAAESEWSSGTPNLRAIAVRTDRRGEGLGADITAAVTRAALVAGAPAVTLGMYADNDPARRMYERLGFRVGQAFASRAVEPR